MSEKEKHDRNRATGDTGQAAKPATPPETASQEGEGAADAAGEQIAKLMAEKDELTQTLIRRQADFENYRKRIERDKQEEHRRGVGRIIEELLPVLDGFERAIKSDSGPEHEDYRKGLELLYRQLWDVLARQGVERIAAEGKVFDPHFHQAIERVETSEHPDGTIVDVVHDGYLYHGRVLRPSLVRVAVHTEEHSAAERG